MKLSIIGLGSVGSAIATAVHNTGLIREMVLFDRDGVRALAAAEDLGHASLFGYDIKITAASNYREMRGSDIVIIAAGANQKPGQTRTDLLHANADVIRDIMTKLVKVINTEKTIVIVATNPLDVMTELAATVSGMPKSHIIGTGTMLDSARFKLILSRGLGVSPASISAFVLGEHGDSSVLNWSMVNIGGLPLADFCKQTKTPLTAASKRTIEHRVRFAAYEIIKGRGATWDGIGAAVVDLVRCIANDERRILTVSIGNGSLPRIVGADGVIATLQPKLNSVESAGLRRSMQIIKKNIAALK